MVFEEQKLKGVFLISPDIFIDNRGYFFESFKEQDFKKELNCRFVQDNEVFSSKVNTIRGLHYQLENSQGKLIHVLSGAIKDVIVDIRTSSSTFGKSFSIDLDHKNHKMLFIPKGFAHGYLVLKKKYNCQFIIILQDLFEFEGRHVQSFSKQHPRTRKDFVI